MSDLADLTPIFVYGTLRKGEGNYRWVRPCVEQVTEDVTTDGQIFFVHGRGSYPVAKFDLTGTIHGDILWCKPQVPEYEQMVGMEMGAGYEKRRIEVRHPAQSETIGAFGFHYVSDPRGERIMSGDWVRATRD